MLIRVRICQSGLFVTPKTSPFPSNTLPLSQEAIDSLKKAEDLANLFAFGSESGHHDMITNEVDSSKTAPETADIYFLLGQCYTEQLKHHDALHAYSYAIKVS